MSKGFIRSQAFSKEGGGGYAKGLDRWGMSCSVLFRVVNACPDGKWVRVVGDSLIDLPRIPDRVVCLGGAGDDFKICAGDDYVGGVGAASPLLAVGAICR